MLLEGVSLVFGFMMKESLQAVSSADRLVRLLILYVFSESFDRILPVCMLVLHWSKSKQIMW